MTRTHLRTLYRLRARLFESSKAEREETYLQVRDSYQMRPPFLVMLVLACLVALLGLLGNSPAVVIGAMLISPLMSPFLSAGLALAIGDWGLGRAALRTIFLSVLAAVSISYLAVAASPLKEATPEILGRTNPNLLDLGIAFFSGFAGTYTVVARKSGTTIPGVAIATAVMPPLCVVGFGAYVADAEIAFGALSLFVTNLAAIVISAACVFLLASFRASDRPDVDTDGWGTPLRFVVSFLVLGLLAVPLGVALVQAATVSQLRQTVRATLKGQIERDPSRARLGSGWVVSERPDSRVVVEAMARTVSYFNSREVDEIERSLERACGKAVDLRLEQVKVQQGGLDPEPDPLSAAVQQAPPPPSFEDTVRMYRPAAELAASVLEARVDRYFVVADEEGVRRIDLFAFRDEVAPDDLVAAARRAVAAWSAESGRGPGAPPGLEVHVRPAEPVRLEVAPPKGARGRPGLEPALPALERVRALLDRDPALKLRLVVENVPEEEAGALRSAALEAVEAAEGRLAGEGDASRAVEVRLAYPRPEPEATSPE